MSTLVERAGALVADSGAHESVIAEHVLDRAELAGIAGSATRRRIERSDIDIAVFRDVGRGRGSARLRVSPSELTPGLIARLVRQAQGSLEPLWRLPPPAAPARVAVADPALSGQLMTAVDVIAERIGDRVAARAVVDAAGGPLVARAVDVSVERRRVTLRTSRGFAHAHDETAIAVRVVLVPGAAQSGASAEIRLHGRRLADIDIDDALVRAAGQLHARLRARPTPAGRYDLVLSGDALTAPAAAFMRRELATVIDARSLRFGWLAPFVAQADARLVRHGLARYRPGRPVYERAASGDPLTLVSDGAIPFGLLSSPVGELGEPVRRFALVDRGVAAGLALDLREAAILGVTANGGARNLRVGAGTTAAADIAAPDGAAVLEVEDIDALDVDVMSGAFTAMLGLGHLVVAGERTPVTGGTLRGNLFDLWARARMTAETVVWGWYHGPRAIRCSGVELS